MSAAVASAASEGLADGEGFGDARAAGELDACGTGLGCASAFRAVKVNAAVADAIAARKFLRLLIGQSLPGGVFILP